MRPTRSVVVLIAVSVLLAGCGKTVLWYNPNTGNCDAISEGMAYAMGGALYAATKDRDTWRCEGLQGGDKARTEKPQ